MPQIRPSAQEPGGGRAPGEPGRPGRRTVRYAVPAAVVGAVAAGVGLVPALADTGSPDLPRVTAEELVSRMAASDVESFSGTVRLDTDLGLPALPGLLGGRSSGDLRDGDSPFGGRARHDGEETPDRGGPAAPGARLAELADGEHTLRVAADGPRKRRLSVLEDTAEYSLVRNGNEVWAYDSATDSAFHGVGPEPGASGPGKVPGARAGAFADLTPKQAARKALRLADDTTSVTVDGTTEVAGRAAYRLVLAPKDAAHSTVDSVRIAVDAENGAPLAFTLAPEGGGKPVVDIAYTEVDFGKPEPGTFSFDPPEGTDITEKQFDRRAAEHRRGQHRRGIPRPAAGGGELLGHGWGTVAELHLPRGAASARPEADSAPRSDDRRAQRLLDGFTQQVNGDFGTGRVFESRLFNVLITEDGTVYAGAVTREGLVEAAERAG
ncbi:LolA family protein [Streptomyces sp. TR06-5]|uniref:LolA family protein n=1 Tax=Streptomyces sp. TR06-5 TaxID=3385976 RepID=UPI0039A0FFF2